MSLKNYDDDLRSVHGEYIAGIDECGRGSCAGSIVAACVLMDSTVFIPGVNDSKKLSEKKRDELYEQILKMLSRFMFLLVINFSSINME